MCVTKTILKSDMHKNGNWLFRKHTSCDGDSDGDSDGDDDGDGDSDGEVEVDGESEGEDEGKGDGFEKSRSRRLSASLTYCLGSNLLTVATLTACRVEEIECEKYQLVFPSAVDAFFPLMKRVATPFQQSVPICIKQIMACKPSVAVVCSSKYRLRSNKEKSSNN